VATRLGPEGIRTVLARFAELAGIESELPQDLRGAVELTVRSGHGSQFLFLISRTDQPVDISAMPGTLLSGAVDSGTSKLPPGGVAVLQVP
jgi:beta-galactosidase